MKQILYFSAPWCGPCKSFKPIMESLQSELPITFIDVDSSPQSITQYNVRSVPTTILLKDGVEVSRAIGAKSKEEIKMFFNR